MRSLKAIRDELRIQLQNLRAVSTTGLKATRYKLGKREKQGIRYGQHKPIVAHHVKFIRPIKNY